MSLLKGAPPPLAPTLDAEHLRRIVEKQPGCLMRVGTDGLILAANDAALGLLGAQQPAQVLGSLLTTWIDQAHQEAWREFSQSVAVGSPQSVECDLTDVSGAQRSVVFHGVPLVDHADGIPSLILGARDASAVRRLEAALHESEAARQRQATERNEAPMEDVSGRLQELEAKLEVAEAGRAKLEQALARLPQLEQLLKQGRTHLQDLRTRLEGATRERDQLAARLGEGHNANEALWTERAALQQTLAEQQQQELNDLRAQLQDANAAREQMAARLRERESEHDRLLSEQVGLLQSLEAHQHDHGLLRVRLDEAAAEKDRLASHLAEHDERQRLESVQHQQALDTVRAEMEQAIASQAREADAARHQLAGELDAERSRFEASLATATTRQKESEKALADQRVEMQSLDQAARRIEPLAAAGRLATDIARELLAVVSDIDARTACLLAECPIESPTREEVEQLRADAVRSASMARQILHAGAVTRSEEQS